MKILVTEIEEKWQRDYLSKRLSGHELNFTKDVFTDQLADNFPDTEVLCVFIGSELGGALISSLPRLRYITTRSTGFDHIDLADAQANDVLVSNVPYYGENTVAEHTMALLLALARNLPASFTRVENAHFDYRGLRGWDLKGKCVGILGGGHIGIHVARRCRAFEMEVLVYDINQNTNLAKEVGFEYVSLERLLSSADVISLHLPLNKHTYHILAENEFGQMKDGVFIINTARGGLIDTNALVQALRRGKVSGAGLDVLEGEGFFKDELNLLDDPKYKDQLKTLLEGHVLMEMENVLVTPHNAFNSYEALERILDTTIENIQGFARGKEQNLVGESLDDEK